MILIKSTAETNAKEIVLHGSEWMTVQVDIDDIYVLLFLFPQNNMITVTKHL